MDSSKKISEQFEQLGSAREAFEKSLENLDAIGASSEKIRKAMEALAPDHGISQALKDFNAIRNIPSFSDAMNLSSAKALANAMANIERDKVLPKDFRAQTPESTNQYQSAGELMRTLAESITKWRSTLPDTQQPEVIALLNGGVQINVTSLAQESFHGIRIEGTISGAPCIVLAHQNTVQLMCYIAPVRPPEKPKRKIGFIIDGQESEA